MSGQSAASPWSSLKALGGVGRLRADHETVDGEHREPGSASAAGHMQGKTAVPPTGAGVLQNRADLTGSDGFRRMDAASRSSSGPAGGGSAEEAPHKASEPEANSRDKSAESSRPAGPDRGSFGRPGLKSAETDAALAKFEELRRRVKGAQSSAAKLEQSSKQPAAKPDEKSPATPSHAASEENDSTFFELRRSLRQLQFKYEVGTPYSGDIRKNFEDILGTMSQASVQYQLMSGDFARYDQVKTALGKSREELRKEQATRKKIEAKASGMESELERQHEKTATVLDELKNLQTDLELLRDGHQSAQEEINRLEDLLKAEKEARKGDVERVQLLKAETDVLRESLSDACDTIADGLSLQYLAEGRIQELEDEVARLKIVAGGDFGDQPSRDARLEAALAEIDEDDLSSDDEKADVNADAA